MDAGDARLGREDADEIQRIGGAQHDQLARSSPSCAPRAAGRPHPGRRTARRRSRRRSARRGSRRALRAAVHAHEFAPWRQLRFALQQRAENDAVSLQQRSRDRLNVVAFSLLRSDQRPGRFHQATRAFPAARAARAARQSCRRWRCRRRRARPGRARRTLATILYATPIHGRTRRPFFQRFAHCLRLGGQVRIDGPRRPNAPRARAAAARSASAQRRAWPGVRRPHATRPLRHSRSICSPS